MAFNPDQYYPHRPGGPFIPALPRIRRTNFDTEKTIEDRVRNISEFQGANEQEMQGYIQNEIDKSRTDTVGLTAHKGTAAVNRAADTYDGH